MDERQDPRARLGPLGDEPAGGAPDGEERLLHRVLGERLVAQDAEREAVGDAAVAVVQLGERDLLGARDERDDCFVGEVSEIAGHVLIRPRGQDGSISAGPNRTRKPGE